MKKTILVAMVAMLGGATSAATETIDGVIWSYSVSGGAATITGAQNVNGKIITPERLGGCPVTRIGSYAFKEKLSLSYIVLSEGITYIGGDLFWGCSNLCKVKLPSTLQEIDWHAFYNCSRLGEIVIPASVKKLQMTYDFHPVFEGCPAVVRFEGLPPANIAKSGYSLISYRLENAVAWKTVVPPSKFYGYYVPREYEATVISSMIRESDPTIIDVVYKVTSKKPTVKVRVLAFEDGVRSFAKVVRPETFVTDTNGVATTCNVGDNVTPNVEHTISWRVSSDWKTKLAKVSFEVLVCEGELLPLELMTIPASDQYGKMKISWNAISESQLFDALLWLYADRTEGLTLVNGVLKNGAAILVNGVSIKTVGKNANSYYDYNGSAWWTDTVYPEQWQSAPEYVFSKMGFSTLSGAKLTYANSETRLGLSPSGARQYAYKIVEE